MLKILLDKIRMFYFCHECILLIGCIFVIILNILVFQSMAIGLPFGILFIFTLGAILGRSIFSTYCTSIQIFLGTFLALWGISGLGALLYYFSTLKTLIIVLFIVLSSLAILCLHKQKKHIARDEKEVVHTRTKKVIETKQQPSSTALQWGLLSLHLFSSIKVFGILLQHATKEAVRTPWALVPTSFWLFTFMSISTLVLLFLLIKHDTSKKQVIGFALLPASLTVLLFLLLPIILYPLGFGFDPYIHQAAERVIAETGVITPKTPYYIGQYALVVILAKILAIPVTVLDRLLLPLLASLFLFPALFLVLQKTMVPDRRIALTSAFFLFLVPFTSLTITTPQGIVNLLSIFVIFGCFFLVHQPSAASRSLWWILIFLASTASLIHPLIGIPISFFVFAIGILLFIKKKTLRYIALGVFTLVGMILTPTLFFVGRLFHILPESTNPSLLPSLAATLSNIPLPAIPNRFTLINDFIALFTHNLPWLVFIGALAGLMHLIFTQHNKTILIFPIATAIAFINSLLLSASISFDFLISYERDIFSQRITEIGFYFLLPFFLYACALILKKTLEQQIWYCVFFLFVVTLLLMTSLYASYPRNDRYITGRNFNTSKHDFTAVDWIEKDANDTRYIVLANQMVSAAALTRFGFTRYFPTPYGELYLYPIPTSSPLYSSYLKMVYEAPERQTVLHAMDFMRVDLAYLVLNDYWADFKKLVPKAEREADDMHNIDDGKVVIFRYERKNQDF